MMVWHTAELLGSHCHLKAVCAREAAAAKTWAVAVALLCAAPARADANEFTDGLVAFGEPTAWKDYIGALKGCQTFMACTRPSRQQLA